MTDFFAPVGVTFALATDAPVNAGTINILVSGNLFFDDYLSGGEWFEIAHPTRLSRAYVITDIDTVTVNSDGTRTYTVGILPPTRESAASGTLLNTNRPRCLMRLAPDSTISAEVQGFWLATPDVSFIESFGTV